MAYSNYNKWVGSNRMVKNSSHNKVQSTNQTQPSVCPWSSRHVSMKHGYGHWHDADTVNNLKKNHIIQCNHKFLCQSSSHLRRKFPRGKPLLSASVTSSKIRAYRVGRWLQVRLGVWEGGLETHFPYSIPGVVKLREEAPTRYTTYIYYNIYSRVGVGHDHDTPNLKSVCTS